MSDHRHQRTGRHAVSRRSEPLHLATEARGFLRFAPGFARKACERSRGFPYPETAVRSLEGLLRARFGSPTRAQDRPR
jgi:hypothetical protein